MFPIILDAAFLPIALVGSGEKAVSRLMQLKESGASKVTVFAESPSPELRALAGGQLIERLPEVEDFAQFQILFIVDIGNETATRLAGLARSLKLLVNVEDTNALCDFHIPSIVRRGDLLLTASTGGRSPALARTIKQYLAKIFNESWGEKLALIARKREEWRAHGDDFQTVLTKSDKFIAEQGWFPSLAGEK